MRGQTLRPYQERAINDLRASLAAGNQRVVLTLPTGAGKTTVAAHVIDSAVSKGKKVLFLAHQRELIDQCSARLDGEQVEHGVIMAGHRRYMPWLPVQVASVQTIARRKDLPEADLIIPDECHHVRSATYEKLLELYPRAHVVGLTATPIRTDGKGLGEAFQDLVIGSTVKELTDLGHLVPHTGFAWDVPELREVRKTKTGDLDEHGLELVMGGTKIMGSIVDQWLRHARGLRTVVFAVNVAHSKEIVARFVARGVKAEHVDGSTPKVEREAILDRVRSGETTVVSNCALLTEGVDIPALECAVLARPTLSLSLHLQTIGRVLRPAPGKTRAVIHDHAGNILRHGPPDLERAWTLDMDERKGGKKQATLQVRICKQCFAAFSPTESAACPACGHEAEANRRKLEEIEEAEAIPLEDLEKRRAEERAERREKPELMRAVYRSLKRTQETKGYKPGYVGMKFRAHFGIFPPQWLKDEEGRAAA